MNPSLRIIPLILIVAMLAFSVRVGEVVSGFRALSGSAVAADAKKENDKNAATETASASTDKDPAAPEKSGQEPDEANIKKSDHKKDPSEKSKQKSWPNASDIDPDLINVRDGLIKDLAQRRTTIEVQEKNIATREAMLKAAQDELDQKFQELLELRKQLQGLLNQQSEEEAERLKSLVRIYEGMKPSDAARIFNTLDINVLLDVMTRMSERKSAPILAAMEADRARMVTIMMAQQKKLPDLPALGTENTP